MNTLRIYRQQGGQPQTDSVTLRSPACLVGKATDCDIRIDQGPDLALEFLPAPVSPTSPKGRLNWTVQSFVDGTLNGRPLSAKTLLKHGDRIEVAGLVLIYEETEAPSDSTQSALSKSASDSGAASAARQAAFISALQEFARHAAADSDVDQVLKASLDAARTALEATEAFVFIIGPDGAPKSVAGLAENKTEARFSDSVVQTVLREGRGLCLAQATQDSRFSSAQSITELQLHSVLCAPVRLGGKVTGCVYLGTRKPHITYGEADLKAAEALAQTIGLLVHHVEFIAKQSEALSTLAVGGETGWVGQSPAMLKVLREADAVAASDIGVLIQGETGTGKELMAERLHRRSPRGQSTTPGASQGPTQNPFVAVNCSSLRGELLESELFGYKRGAFTGAVADRQGLFAAARGGTLFLDEIGEMDMALQAKLLRAIETGKIRPVGATQEESVDVRVICATHRDLKALVAEKQFREDLYYRLAPITLRMPPLRERGGDVALLAHAFLARFKARYPGKEIAGFSASSLRAMAAYAWPGNIRELLNAVHRAVLLSSTPLIEVDLGTGTNTQGEPEFLGFDEATTQFQKRYLQEALALVDGNREQAAKTLKMSRSTFFRYLAQLGVE